MDMQLPGVLTNTQIFTSHEITSNISNCFHFPLLNTGLNGLFKKVIKRGHNNFVVCCVLFLAGPQINVLWQLLALSF